jgi:uncharacterized protein YndB with AHSA1/START domain
VERTEPTPVDFLLFDGMDLMDFAGPWEVVLTANRLLERRGQPPAFAPSAYSPQGGAVRSYGGVPVGPTGTPQLGGVVVVPGTIDVDAALADQGLMAAVAEGAERSEVVASVCTGAFLLARCGLLAGRQWTTHWEDIAAMGLPGGSRGRVVDTGEVITGGGLSCGIDVGLALVARFADPSLARLVARQLDYPWDSFGDDTGGHDPVVVGGWVASSPDAVYRLWTTSAGVSAFLDAPAIVEGRIGGAFEVEFLTDAPAGGRGSEGCRFLALEPGRMVVFTWNSPPGLPTRGVHTWVVLTLRPEAGGTRVRLAHWGHGSGPQWDANRAYFRTAWGRVLQALADHCAR